MARSDAAWVDVLPRMKDFAAPLVKGVKDAAREAGIEGGKALSDSMSAEAKKTNLNPLVEQLEKVEKAAKSSADQQAASARKAADEVGRAKQRIMVARAQESNATAQVVKAEGDLEKRRTVAATRSSDVQKAEQNLAAKREDVSTSAEDLSKAEGNLADARRKATSADADVAAAAAKVEAARARQAATAQKTSNEETALKAAINESKTAQVQAASAAEEHARAQAELGAAVEDAGQEATKAVPLWRRLWDGVGDTAGVKERVKSTLAGVREEISKEGARIQSRGEALLGGLGKGLKWGAVGLGAGIAGGLGAAATGGFKRLADIEDARASLLGLKMSAQDVDSVMASALDSVKGTAYAMGDAASVAATMTAAGIKPGKDLTRTLSLVADSATIAKRDIGDMGLIWSSVASKGQLQGDDAMQLLESGIPIWQMVGEQMGITAGEAQELGSKGQVSFEVFRDAMEKNLGGAALKSGETVRGSFANMKAAVSRFGAAMLEGVFPLIAPALQKVIGVLDAATAAAEPFFKKMTDGARGLYDLLVNGDFTGALTSAFGWEEDSPAVGVLLSLRDAAISVAEWFQDHLWPVLQSVGSWIGDNLVPILSGVGAALAYLGGTAVVGAIGALIGVIGSAVGAIGWIPLAIGAAVSALTWFFTKTETGKAVLDGLIGVLGGVWEAVKVVATGDFHGGIFGLAEDSPIIGALISIHDMIVDVGAAVKDHLVDGWKAVVTAWETGDAGDNPILRLLVKLKDIGTGVWDGIVGAVEKVKGALSSLGGSGGSGLTQFFDTLGWVAEQVGGYLTGVWNLLKGVGSFIAQVVTGVILPALSDLWGFVANTLAPIFMRLWTDYVGPALAAIGAAGLWLYGNVLGPALTGIGWLLSNVVGPAFTWLYGNVISPVITAIGAVVTFVFNNVVFPILDGLKWVLTVAVPAAAQFLWGVISGVWNAIASVTTWLYTNVIVPVWTAIKVAIAVVIAVVMTAVQAWMWLFQNVVAPVFRWLYSNVIVPVWTAIKVAIAAVVSWWQGTAWPIISTVIGWLRQRFEDLKAGLGVIWAFIQNSIIKPVISWFRDTAWPLISGVIDKIKAGFNTMRDAVQMVWHKVRTEIINPVVVWFLQTVKPTIDRVTGGISDAFTVMKDGIKSAWDKVRDAARAPVKFVIDTVYNSGLRANFNKVADTMKLPASVRLPAVSLPPGFAGGGLFSGILPGSSRMQDGDDQLIAARRGEGILVSEGLRDPASRAAFLRTNELAKRGVSFAQAVAGGGFAGGGLVDRGVDFVKGVGGDAIDWLKDTAGFAADILTDPKGALTKLVDGFLENIPDAGVFTDMVKAVPRNIARAIGDILFGSFTSGGGDAGAVPIGGGRGGSLGQTLALARSMGLVLTSSGRRGARTAQNGLVSLHALGRAHDYAGASGTMMRFFNAVDAQFSPTELLYSPAGARNKHRSGRRGPNTGATLRNHYSHVHVGFASGGIVPAAPPQRGIGRSVKPMLYDKGGWLKPGVTLVNNASGTPEPIFPGKQGASIIQMLEAGGKGGRDITIPITATQLSEADVDRLADEILRRLHAQLSEIGD